MATPKASAAAFEIPFVRSAYNYDRNAASDESGLSCPEPTRTKQEFADEADINTIVKRFGLGGQLPSGVVVPTYGDFEGVFDMHSAVQMVAAAEQAFMSMPADVRFRFDNNPALFVDFVSDESNRAEAQRLGIVNLPPVGAAPVAVAAPVAASEPVAGG
ncbi:scaffold protein [Microviridae sp.]|nr:scaffold protein [Microviridae sp.]